MSMGSMQKRIYEEFHAELRLVTKLKVARKGVSAILIGFCIEYTNLG